MRIRNSHLVRAILIAIILLGSALHSTRAQIGSGYDLTWNTIDGGGPLGSTDGGYRLSGTFGQSDAGEALAGGGYSLLGGFWSGIPGYFLYLPLVTH